VVDGTSGGTTPTKKRANVTVTDLDRFLRAVIAGKLLSPELTSAFLSPQVVHSRRELDRDVRVTVLRRSVGQGLLLRKGGSERRRQRHNLPLSGPGHTATLLSNMKDGVWDPAWKIHDMVVEGQMTEF
jgi:hypothetical protein